MSILSEGIETDNDQRTTNKGILIGGANIYMDLMYLRIHFGNLMQLQVHGNSLYLLPVKPVKIMFTQNTYIS